jgi:hypothetical protein
MIDKPEPRRSPLPWSAEETDAYYIVRDANGQALAYVYFGGRAALSGRFSPDRRLSARK